MDRDGRTVWTQVDDARGATGWVVAGYLSAVAAVTALVAVPVALFLPVALEMQLHIWNVGARAAEGRSAGNWPTHISPNVAALTVAMVGIVVVLAIVQVARAKRGGKRELLMRGMGARPVTRGEAPETFGALYDMSVAVGRTTSPALYIIDDEAVNAAILGESPERCSVVVTRGFARRVAEQDQRAVFANLFARLRFGRTRALLLLSALLVPIRRLNVLDRLWRAYVQVRDPDTGPGFGRVALFFTVFALLAGTIPALVLFFLIPMAVMFIVVTFAAWAADQIGYRAYVGLSQFGDDEGMVLLNDPHEMLAALDRVLAEDNRVPAVRVAMALFYCWPGEIPPVAWDPERDRVDRLRAIVGAEGVESDADWLM